MRKYKNRQVTSDELGEDEYSVESLAFTSDSENSGNSDSNLNERTERIRINNSILDMLFSEAYHMSIGDYFNIQEFGDSQLLSIEYE